MDLECLRQINLVGFLLLLSCDSFSATYSMVGLADLVGTVRLDKGQRNTGHNGERKAQQVEERDGRDDVRTVVEAAQNKDIATSRAWR